jgi:hypothetical protein
MTLSDHTRSRRALLVAVLALVVWAAILVATGGFAAKWFGLRIASHDPVRPLILALGLLGYRAFALGWHSVDADVEWLFGELRVAMTPVVATVAAGVLLLGMSRGILVAGGADSYGYVSQADLWLRHDLRIEQPFVQDLPLPYADQAFSPLGYRPVATGHAIVPTYPPGLPMLMAAFKWLAGPLGPYGVVPVLAALTVWLCYRIGARAGSPFAGATAAIVLASSPVFLFQLVWPMSDIPAAAFWTAALFFALGPHRYSSAAAGLCAAVAIAIRPNLAPLAAMPLVYLWMRGSWRPFVLGVLPGICLIAAVNAYLYGSPFISGYGDVGPLYALSNAPINLKRYGEWLLMTQTPLIVLAVAGVAAPPRFINWFLAAFASGVFLAYLFYSPFDDWWYLRFLLPALPAILILMTTGSVWLLGRMPRLLQAVVFSCGAILLVSYQVDFVVSRGVFLLREGERRYETVGQYLASATPANAVFLSMQHSGSIRYYSGRLTLRYDWVPPDWLDRAIGVMRDRGYRPYIVLEDWEEPVFKRRFGSRSETGQLAWRPLKEFTEGMPVRLYEPR